MRIWKIILGILSLVVGGLLLIESNDVARMGQVAEAFGADVDRFTILVGYVVAIIYIAIGVVSLVWINRKDSIGNYIILLLGVLSLVLSLMGPAIFEDLRYCSIWAGICIITSIVLLVFTRNAPKRNIAVQIKSLNKCPNCGAQVADDSRFCTECGKEFPQGNVCPHCGASVNEGDAFCVNCGKNLNAPIDEEPIQYKEEDEPKKNKFIPILAALLLLAMIGGGWWYYKSTSKVDSTETVSDTVAEETDIAEDMAVDTVAAYDEGAVESAVESSHGSYDDFHHDFNSSSYMHHNLAGTFTDNTGVYPIEISFSNKGNEVSNVIYKNIKVGSKIPLVCTEFGKNRICFEGKDGKNSFVISLNNTESDSFVGSASVGNKGFDVEVTAECSH